MTVRIDPENNEIRALLDLADLDGRQVLEIGAGDCRLTRRYADRVSSVTAVEPFADSVARARRELPDRLASRIELHHASFEDFAASSEPARFDTAIMSWSLCCMAPELRDAALEQVHRLLRPGGTLIDIHPVPVSLLIEVAQGGRNSFVTPHPSDDGSDAQQADDALEHAVERHLFHVVGSAEFDLVIYAASLAELQDFCAMVCAFEERSADEDEEDWPPDLCARIEAALDAAGAGATVAIREQGRITRLDPVGR